MRACGLTSASRSPPASELRLTGERHTLGRDRQAVSYHYDAGNDVLQAVPRPVDDVQLRLLPDRRQDAGGGPAGQAGPRLHQARLARGRAGAGRRLRLGQLRDPRRPELRRARARRHALRGAGPARPRARRRGGRVRISWSCGWRTTASWPASRFDAISSIGMVEHVGEERIDLYMRTLHDLLRPGGRLLNHGIAKLMDFDDEGRGRVLRALRVPRRRAAAAVADRAGDGAHRASSVRHVEGFPEDYARTLRLLDRELRVALRRGGAAGRDRARPGLARLPAGGARQGFRTGYASVYQVLAHKPTGARFEHGLRPGIAGADAPLPAFVR